MIKKKYLAVVMSLISVISLAPNIGMNRVLADEETENVTDKMVEPQNSVDGINKVNIGDGNGLEEQSDDKEYGHDYDQDDVDDTYDIYSDFGTDDPMAGRANGYVDKGFFDDSESEIATYSLYANSVTHNSKFNGSAKRTGIDVSSWQGNINWNQVKASGVEFAFIRVGYRGYASGSLDMDRKAIDNINGAKKAGIKIGVYIRSQAVNVNEAYEEADYITSKISGYNIDLPVVIDYEYASGPSGRLYDAHLTQAAATDVVNAFCSRVQSKGYIGMVYANKSMLNNSLYKDNISSKELVWLANYTHQTDYAGDYRFWQYTSTGHVDGIDGNVDVDVWYDDGTLFTGEYSVCNGVYTISSKLNENMVLDVANASWENGANIQLYKSNGTNAQKFRISYASKGNYIIENIYSRKLIDVSAGSTANGANIQQYNSNDSYAQRWILKPTGDGYFEIVSPISGKCLNVAAKSAVNGANIELYQNVWADSQKFKLSLCDGGQTLQSGVYEIESSLNYSQVLDVSNGSHASGANVQLYRSNGTEAQKWVVSYLGNGYYNISNLGSSKSLDVSNAGRSNGTNIQQYSANGTVAQQWIIRDAGNGYYYIIARNSGYYVDLYNGWTGNGTNVQLYGPNGSGAQKFRFKSVGATYVSDGDYCITSAVNGNYALDIANASREAYGNVQLYWKNYTGAQKFRLHAVGDGYYTIQNVNSRLYLDVSGASLNDSANVQQYYGNGTAAQKWQIIQNADHSYTFVSAASGKVLDVHYGNVTNGGNIQQYTNNRSGSQKFWLHRL